MRPISFKKGTLLLRFPSKIVDKTAKLSARCHDYEWCVVLYDNSDKILIIGQGAQEYTGASIINSGGQVHKLPEWWENGSEITPEAWVVAQMFGTTGSPIDIGSDE